MPSPLDVLGVVMRMVIAPRVPITSTTAPARQIFPQSMLIAVWVERRQTLKIRLLVCVQELCHDVITCSVCGYLLLKVVSRRLLGLI